MRHIGEDIDRVLEKVMQLAQSVEEREKRIGFMKDLCGVLEKWGLERPCDVCPVRAMIRVPSIEFVWCLHNQRLKYRECKKLVEERIGRQFLYNPVVPKEIARSFMDSLPVLFYGEFGIGKTTLLAKLVFYLCGDRYLEWVYWRGVPDDWSVIESELDKLILIDDVILDTRQKAKNFDQLVDEKYKQGDKRLILASNYTLDELAEKLSVYEKTFTRAVDRLKRMKGKTIDLAMVLGGGD